MNAYHYIWLSAHPHRTEAWLKERLADGFDIHHADLNHNNNAPDNLILIDHRDHMLLHHGQRFFISGRGTAIGTNRTRKEKPLYPKPIGPKPHWRARGRIPHPYTLEYYQKRWPQIGAS